MFPATIISLSLCRTLFCLVLHGHVSEQVAHRLAIVDSSDRLGEEGTDVNGPEFGAVLKLGLVRHSVGHHNLVKKEK